MRHGCRTTTGMYPSPIPPEASGQDRTLSGGTNALRDLSVPVRRRQLGWHCGACPRRAGVPPLPGLRYLGPRVARPFPGTRPHPWGLTRKSAPGGFFARARCAQCGHDFLVAFSCKGRALCPSCNTRRMVETAAHLVDHVFPRLPVRQGRCYRCRSGCVISFDTTGVRSRRY
jgi:hypothetical protein